MANMRKLTPNEVASKTFTPVRMREGYSTDEVDEFLELVENTIVSYESDILSAKQEYEALKNKPIQQDKGALSKVQADLVETRKKLVEAEKSLVEAEKVAASVRSLQSTLSSMGKQTIEQREAKEKSDVARIAAEKELASLKEELEVLRNQPQGASQEELDSFEKSLNEAKAEIAEKTEKLSVLEKQEAEAVSRATKAESENSLLSAQLEELKQDMADGVMLAPQDMMGATATIARMLENAAKNHDDLLAQGEAEAMRIRGEAEEELEEMKAEAAKIIAAELAEVDAKKSSLILNLEGEEERLKKSVAELRLLEARARESLKRSYEDALKELSSMPLMTN